MHTDFELKHSKDWNKRTVWNKRTGGKILKKTINVPSGIVILGEDFVIML